MIIAGIDPGLTATGYGIIKTEGNRIAPLNWGVIRSGKGNLSERLLKIHTDLTTVLHEARPDVISVEEIFAGYNPRGALMLGHARGVILLAGITAGCPVREYPARSVKQSVAGRGNAAKDQIRYMVAKMLAIEGKKVPMDASDALAVAICCMMRDGKNKTQIDRR